MVLDIATVSTSTCLAEVWPPAAPPEPPVPVRHNPQDLSASELYGRYLQGARNTPFERVFNRMLKEADAGTDRGSAAWIALGEWAVIRGVRLARDRSSEHEFGVKVAYDVDPLNHRYGTERDIIRSMAYAQRDRGGIGRTGFPNLMNRPLALYMPKGARPEWIHTHLMSGGGIAVKGLRGVGAYVRTPAASKRLQVA